MTQEDFDSAKVIQAQISAITEVQAKNSIPGAKALISIAPENFRGGQVTNFDDLQEILGTDYDTIANTAKASLVSALAAKKASLQSDFDDLGI